MPEISRFYGVVVRMFSEPSGVHHLPHFHASYQGSVAVYGVDPVVVLEGALPQRQGRLVEAWAELHQDELMADWRNLQAGRLPTPIAPLQ